MDVPSLPMPSQVMIAARSNGDRKYALAACACGGRPGALELRRPGPAELFAEDRAEPHGPLEVQQQRAAHVVVVGVLLDLVVAERLDQAAGPGREVAAVVAEHREGVGQVPDEVAQGVLNLAVALPEVRHVVDVAEGDARLVEAPLRGALREGPVVLEPAEPLLLDEGDDLAVAQERRRGVVVLAQAEYVHGSDHPLRSVRKQEVRSL
ncbi:hypothetical protein R8Z50_18055 [Longispora sp. K20-0274]